MTHKANLSRIAFAAALLALTALPAGALVSTNKTVSPSEVDLGQLAQVTLTITADDDVEPFPLDVMLVLDKSDTMGDPMETQALQKFIGALDRAEALEDELDAVPGTQIGLVSFGGTICNPSVNADSECEGLDFAGIPQQTFDDIRFNPALPSGVTPLADAIDQAQAHLVSNAGRDEAAKCLVLLTDGIESVGDQGDVADSALAAQAAGTTIVAVTFGDDPDAVDFNLVADEDFHEPAVGNMDQVASACLAAAGGVVAREVEVIENLGPTVDLAGGVTVAFSPGESPVALNDTPQIVGKTIRMNVAQMRDNDEYQLRFNVVASRCGDHLVDGDGSRVEWLGPDGPPKLSEPFPNRTLTVSGQGCEPPPPPPPGPGELSALLACFFECKPGESDETWEQITTLMLTNLEPNLGAIGNLSLVVRDGVVGPAIGVIENNVGALDFDEVHVCRSLEVAGLSVPSAGRIDVLQRNVLTVENSRPLRVYGWIKNVLGIQRKDVNEPFSPKNRVSSIGKTECRVVPGVGREELEARLDAIAGLPRITPILVEDTHDPVIGFGGGGE